MDERNPAEIAKFNLEFMAMMLQCGRTTEAAEAYKTALEQLTLASAELDLLREIAPDPSPLSAIPRPTH